jgi:hypothetical protein
MSNCFKILTTILLIVSFLACKNDDPARENATAAVNEEIAALNGPLSPSIGKLAIGSPEKLVLDNNKEIELPAVGDTSMLTLFILRSAESVEGKTSLSEAGLNRAGYLASFMEKIGFFQAFVEGNSAMQTGMFSAQGNQAEVNLFKAERAEELLRMIVGNYKGKRVMLIGMPQTVPALLNILAGEIVEGKMPENEYDHFYVVKVKSWGDVEITHLKY